MRGGHIDEEATAKAHALFSERERARPWWRRLVSG
jgi:hypothetical protein